MSAPQDHDPAWFLLLLRNGTKFEKLIGDIDTTDALVMKAHFAKVWDTIQECYRMGDLVEYDVQQRRLEGFGKAIYDHMKKLLTDNIKERSELARQVKELEHQVQEQREKELRSSGATSLETYNAASGLINPEAGQLDLSNELQISMTHLSVDSTNRNNPSDGNQPGDFDMFNEYTDPDFNAPSPDFLENTETPEPTVNPSQLQAGYYAPSPGPVDDTPPSSPPTQHQTVLNNREIELLRGENERLQEKLRKAEAERDVLRNERSAGWRTQNEQGISLVDKLMKEEIKISRSIISVPMQGEPSNMASASKKRRLSDDEGSEEEESNESDYSSEDLDPRPARKKSKPPALYKPVRPSDLPTSNPPPAREVLTIKVPPLRVGGEGSTDKRSQTDVRKVGHRSASS